MLKLFTLLLSTFILVSCGGGKSTATLSISRGMLLGNTSFSGGIYVTGEKADGSESFAAAITSGNSANVTITFGTWNFKVIGWDGGGLMGGTAYCKYLSNYPFTAEGQQLEVNTSAIDCFNTNISGTNQHVTPNIGPWKNLVVNTCGTLHNPSNSTFLTSSGYTDFCTSGNYSIEYRRQYGYFKLHLENINNAGSISPGITSTCYSAQLLGNAIKYPNRMPVTIKFYQDSGCTAEVDTYRFKKGLDWSLSPTRTDNTFDWQVTADTVSFFVTLANGASKRGTTAFHSEVPVFQCLVAGELVPCPVLPVAALNTYYLDPDAHAMIRIPQATCGTVSYGGSINLGMVTSYSCTPFNGSVYVGLKVNTSTPVNGTLTMDGATYNLKVGNTNATFGDDLIRDTYKTLKRTLGIRNPNTFNNSLQDDFDEGDDERIGLLDPAIYEISSMGAGGVFYDYFAQCSTAAIPQVSRSYVKNGVTYTVALSGISGTPPAFTSRANEPEFMGSEIRYNRRLIVRKFLGASYTTEKIADFSCDNDSTGPVVYTTSSAQVRNGKLEEQRSYSYGDKVVTLKKLMFWNLSLSDKGRFDVYRSKVWTNASGTKQKVERNFYRIIKTNSDAYNHFKIHSLNYETVRDGSAFDENITVNEIDGKASGSDMNYSHKRLMDYTLEDTTIGTLFGTTFKAEMEKVRFGYNAVYYDEEQSKVSSSNSNNQFVQARRLNSQLQIRSTDGTTINTTGETFNPDNIATDISPDGAKKIVAVNYMNTVYYYVIDGGTLSPGTIIASSDPSEIKVGIRDDGSWIVAYIETTSKLLHWRADGTDYTSPYAAYEHKKLDIVKDPSEFYMNYIRTDNVNGQYVELTKSSGASSGYASRNSSNKFTYASVYLQAGTLYATYIHDNQVYTLSVNPTTMAGGAQTNLSTGIYKLRPYAQSFYSNVSSTTAIRSATDTTVETTYPYFSTTIPGFEMKPSYLKTSIFDGYFNTSFATQAN